MKNWLFFINCCLLVVSSCFAEAVRQDVHRSIEEMLGYHVEYKEFLPLIAKRSLKIFFDQFDPYKGYLLNDEVTRFTDMSEKELRNVVSGHYKCEYPCYERADQLVRDAILRARHLRAKIRQNFLQQEISSEKLEPISSFPKTEEMLEKRIQRQLSLLVQAEIDFEGINTVSPEELEKILFLVEKRFVANEERYLSSAGESAISLHILKAFAKSLDAHSSFFSREEAYELRANLEKQFEGIGVILREGIHGIVIKEVMPGGPADRSGQVSPGDLLLSVDGISVSSSSYIEVMDQLKGVGGSLVSLTIKKSLGESKTVSLKRETLRVENDIVSYSYTPFGDGIIGVLDIPSFYESPYGSSCEKDIKEALTALKKKGHLKGLVLDMRRNSGGFLSQAVKVASLFVSSGVIVISKYSNGQMQYLRNIDGRVFYEGPLVVLTSKMSASAAEIVAQALQDYGLALIVGDQRTYGKGTIQYQTVTDESAEAYFKVTVGRYYTVSGRSTQIEGVKADVLVPTVYSPMHVGEKYLPYPLKNDQVPAAFIDSLDGVEASKKAWFRKNYLPHIQKRLSFWTEMLPVLKANSEYRLKHSKNFLSFLSFIRESDYSIGKIPETVGLTDLQTEEAVSIVKDMALLERYDKKRSVKRK